MSDLIQMRPIGVIRSDDSQLTESPVAPAFAHGHRGTVEVFEEYARGLRDIDDFSHVYLLFYLAQGHPAKLCVNPTFNGRGRGVFATRSLCRPNPIGLSIVELVGREDNVLLVDGLDILDGTLLLDIQPHTAKGERLERVPDGRQEQLIEEAVWKQGGRWFDTILEEADSVSRALARF